LSRQEETGQMTVSRPKDIFYSDISSQDVLKDAIDTLQPHSMVSLASPTPAPAWLDDAFNGRRTYLYTLQDGCIPAVAQKMMVQHSGASWEEKSINSGHSPFLSQPDELTNMIVSASKAWN
jgi:hypothetical protein